LLTIKISLIINSSSIKML